jgi:hypothetical protein
MKQWFTRSFLLAAALLGASELVARLFFAEAFAGRFEYGFHPTSGIREKSDGTVSLERAGGRKFIPQTFFKERPPGTYRVMAVGNSVPYGPGKLEDSFPWLIGEKLRSQGIPAEGINLAVVGQGSLRHQVVLRRALRYQPSLVILQVDADLYLNDEVDFRRRAEFLGWHPRVWLMKSLIIRRLYEWKTEKAYWELLPEQVRVKNSANDLITRFAAEAQAASPEKQAARLERFKATIRESVALCRAQGVPVLLFTQGFLDSKVSGPGRFTDRNLDAFSRSLTGDGVQMVSMKEIFQALSDEATDRMFADKNHLWRSGHDAVATAIAQMIRNNAAALR